MGLGRNEGVLSHVFDLLIGAVTAAVAWLLYEQTGETIWSLLLLIIVTASMVWWRMRDYNQAPEESD